MGYRTRIKYTPALKTGIWDRWQRGVSLHAIARLFDRPHTSIRGILAANGRDRTLRASPLASGIIAIGARANLPRYCGRRFYALNRQIVETRSVNGQPRDPA